jgi:hypothetical protein
MIKTSWSWLSDFLLNLSLSLSLSSFSLFFFSPPRPENLNGSYSPEISD